MLPNFTVPGNDANPDPRMNASPVEPSATARGITNAVCGNRMSSITRTVKGENAAGTLGKNWTSAVYTPLGNRSSAAGSSDMTI